jgi:hypothetical protein
MTRARDVDRLVDAFRDYVQALMDHREGRIAGGETVVQAQSNLRDALKHVFGMKVEESAQ